jgi:hypothetical protein
MIKKLPIKARVLSLVFEKMGISDAEILTALKKEYPLDKQVSEKNLEMCLMSLTTSKMITLMDANLKSNGKVEQNLKITEYGYHRLKYLFPIGR